ncbi:unnamed protein product [Cunninghamella blakesleeana]
MPACICVDYLAHEWDTNDIIQANLEIKKQLKQIKKKQLLTVYPDEKEQKSLQIEHDRLIRFQNALWRQMTKLCTPHLGRSNKMIHPSTVNWQKESDITWLYGPLYTNKPILSSQLPSTPPPEGIKSVLKKPNSYHSYINQHHQNSITIMNNNNYYQPWSKSRSESGRSSISSTSSVSSVRFNPDIEKLEYLPESPVKETKIKMNDDYMDYHDQHYWSIIEENEDDEDDVLWSMFLHMFHFISKKSSNYINSLLSYNNRKKNHHSHHHTQSSSTSNSSSSSSSITPSHRESPIELFFLFFTMTKSLTSLLATWVMYQSLLPFIWLINHSKKKHHSSF